MGINRRRFLHLSIGSVGLLPFLRSKAAAIGKKSKFRIGHIKLSKNSEMNSNGLKRLAWELSKRTSVVVELTPKVVDLDRSDLFQTPFLYLSGNEPFTLPSAKAIRKLRTFLDHGGFLVIDSAQEGRILNRQKSFDASVRRLVKILYPADHKGLQIIPKKHVVFRSFYLLDMPYGRFTQSPSMEGFYRDDRIAIAYIKNDMSGAWDRNEFGVYTHDCVPGGERQREMAFRSGINLIMYALCLDYKKDQVHVEFILRRRRWRSR